jgi:hypothetical protein
MVQKENNQKRPDSQTKDAEEGDFGNGSRSFYEAPYRHFVSLHTSVLLVLPGVFPVALHPGRSGKYAKKVFSTL